MHLLFPSHLWRLSLCKLKRQTVSVPRSGVCLSSLTNACLPLWGFWALYDSFVCMHLALVHFSLLPQQQWYSYYAIWMQHIQVVYSPGFFWRQTNEPVMRWWCKRYKCWPVTHWRCWFVWLTQLAMIQRWWMKPSFSGGPERWGKKGKATPDPYMSGSVLGPDGWPTFASWSWSRDLVPAVLRKSRQNVISPVCVQTGPLNQEFCNSV